jgi:hypothetical protein
MVTYSFNLAAVRGHDGASVPHIGTCVQGVDDVHQQPEAAAPSGGRGGSYAHRQNEGGGDPGLRWDAREAAAPTEGNEGDGNPGLRCVAGSNRGGGGPRCASGRAIKRCGRAGDPPWPISDGELVLEIRGCTKTEGP